MLWRYLLWIACVGLSKPTEALDSTYADVLGSSNAQVDKCQQVSGFSFRNQAQPNVQQIARMCSVPECVDITRTLLRSGGPVVFTAFAEPVVAYCWFFLAPGDPCPANPTMDFLYRFKEKIDSCIRATGVSLFDANATQAQEEARRFYFSQAEMPSDCNVLSRRYHVLSHDLKCPGNFRGNLHNAIEQLMFIGVAQEEQRTGIAIPFIGYYYNPGWPVPELPQAAATTPVTPTPSNLAPNSSPQATSASTEVSEDPITSGSAGTISTAVPSSRPRSTKEALPVAPNGSQAEEIDQAMEPAASNPSKPIRTSAPNNGSAPFKPTSDPNGADSQTTSGPKTASHVTTLVAGIAAAMMVPLIAGYVYLRRSRRSSGDKIGGNYSTVDSPSTVGHHVATTAMIRDDIEVILALKKLLPIKQVQDVRMIGSGGYGVVYLVRDTLNNRVLASKRLVQNQITDDKINEFFDEIKTVSKLQHSCIVTFVGATWTNRTDVQALFEYMDGGDLRTYLDTTPATDTWTSEKLTIAMDIADALVYVHSELPAPLVHRDVKSRNILLTKSPLRAKLSDFGVAREVSQNESMTNGVGTSRWLAPEVILGRGDYGTACDIYSFGVVLSELDTHKIPFWDCGDDDPEAMLPEIAIMRMVALEGRQPTFSSSCPSKILEIARLCLAHDPQARPTAITVARLLRDIIE